MKAWLTYMPVTELENTGNMADTDLKKDLLRLDWSDTCSKTKFNKNKCEDLHLD